MICVSIIAMDTQVGHVARMFFKIFFSQKKIQMKILKLYKKTWKKNIYIFSVLSNTWIHGGPADGPGTIDGGGGFVVFRKPIGPTFCRVLGFGPFIKRVLYGNHPSWNFRQEISDSATACNTVVSLSPLPFWRLAFSFDQSQFKTRKRPFVSLKVTRNVLEREANSTLVYPVTVTF